MNRLKLYDSIFRQLKSYGLNIDSFGKNGSDQFYRSAKAQKKDGAYVTSNRDLYRALIQPIVHENKTVLSELTFTEKINALQLITFMTYDAYLGKPDLAGHFYRWGGDILDMDAPLKNDIRTSKAFGLDCSGYVASAFDIVILEDIAGPELAHSEFLKARKEDLLNSIPGETSPHRLNVSDFKKIGNELYNNTQSYSNEWEDKLNAGDFIVIPGGEGVFPHIVSIVKIEKTLYIAESANKGSITTTHIGRTGNFLSLKEALFRLNERKLTYSIRRIN